MKRTISAVLIIFICLCTTISIYAQVVQVDKLKIKPVITWVNPVDTVKEKIGPVSLLELKDSSITICRTLLVPRRHVPLECQTLDIPVIDIKEIWIKEKGVIWGGLFLGAAAGYFIGYHIGHSQGDCGPDDGWCMFTADESGTIGGVIGALCGAIPGAILGASIKIHIPINGDIGNYMMKKEKIRKYSINN